jgi:lipooligosaccharide transport system ATP-binding protein
MIESASSTPEPPVVEATGVRKLYGAFAAVDGVDFRVNAGECFGFLGPNGAGKTTTMRLIAAAGPVSAGRLSVFGASVEANPRALKRRIGVVPQEDNLDIELTVMENLLVYARYFDIGSRPARQRAESLLEFLQLHDKAAQSVATLSGGMKRRLMIARGLINEPELLVLDEPTTGLDPQARHLVWDKLRRIKGEKTTLLLTTHYMDEAEQLCDRLVIMEKGRIMDEGSPRALIQKHVTREVLELHGSGDARRRALEYLNGRSRHCEVLDDRLLVYADEAETLLHELAAIGGGSLEFFLRRSTLEDVFLRLTGRSLTE